jgi:hypothetical protein
MSLALERVCETLDLRVQDDPTARLVAKKVIELAQRGLRQRAEFCRAEGIQIRRMIRAAGFPRERFKNAAVTQSNREQSGTKGWA